MMSFNINVELDEDDLEVLMKYTARRFFTVGVGVAERSDDDLLHIMTCYMEIIAMGALYALRDAYREEQYLDLDCEWGRKEERELLSELKKRVKPEWL